MKFKVYFSFTLTDQVFPLKDQNVTISVPAGLTVSKHSLTTDDAGETEEVTVTCNVPNFKGEIEYILLARYYLQEVYAKSEDRTEYNPKDPVSFQKKETIVIGCDPPVLKTLMLYGGNPTMLKGETNPVACHGIDQYGHEITIPPESIEYFIQDQEPPNVDVVSIGENSVTAVNPGAASIRARHIPSGKESIYSAHFAVAYEGILEPKETSNDVCKCKEDLPFFLDNWWIVKYEGIWNIKLWISTNKSFNAPSAAKLVGTNTITYDITGMYNTRCAPYTFSEHLDITGVLSRNSTIEQMLNGALIQFSFWYEDFLGRFKTIDFNAIMDPATNSINIGLNHYWPDDCVNYVYSNGRLQ
jgi:hypothetical protein